MTSNDNPNQPRPKRRFVGFTLTAIVAFAIGAVATAIPAILTSQAHAEELAAADAALAGAQAELATVQDELAAAHNDSHDFLLSTAKHMCDESAEQFLAAREQFDNDIEFAWRDDQQLTDMYGVWTLSASPVVADPASGSKGTWTAQCSVDDTDGYLSASLSAFGNA